MRPADLLARLRPRTPVLAPAKCDGREVALQVDADDGVPVLLGHVEAHGVAEDAGVVHEDVEAAALGRPPAATRPGAPSHDATSSPLASACRRRRDLVDDLLGRGRVGRRPRAPRRVVDDDRAPSAASSSASARPMPRPAPVTIATLPSSVPMAGDSSVRAPHERGARSSRVTSVRFDLPTPDDATQPLLGRGTRGPLPGQAVPCLPARALLPDGRSAPTAGATTSTGRRRAGGPRSTPGRWCTRTTCPRGPSGCPTWLPSSISRRDRGR